MDVMIERCAGLDVHKKTVVACVRTPGREVAGRHKAVRTFATTLAGLEALREWLRGNGVTHVAMESTGVYWRPVYVVLEDDFELLLVNARHIKHVPGRKTDVRDCEWVARLLECGLLRGSFVPPPEIRDLRDLTRLRKSLIGERSRQINRVAKTLEMANIKLGSVVTDIMGKTGRGILDALAAGVETPEALARLAQGSLKKKRKELAEATAGRMTEHYRFMLSRHLRLIDELSQHIDELDVRIEERTRPFSRAADIIESMPGIAQRAAQTILAEIGPDMTRFPTSGHLASWAKVCPGTHESAGKRKSVSTGKGNTWLRATLGQVAWSAARTRGSYYSALYYRHRARGGSRKAISVVQHAILVALWHMLSTGASHEDLGNDFFIRRNKERRRRYHMRQLHKLGYTVEAKAAA